MVLMNWYSLLNKEEPKDLKLHKNITARNQFQRDSEALSDAMEDNPEEIPDNIDSPQGSDDKDSDFQAIQDEPDEDGNQDNGDTTEETSSDDMDEEMDSLDGDSDSGDSSSKEIKNNPLEKVNGTMKVIDCFSELEEQIDEVLTKLTDNPNIVHKQFKELENLLEIVRKDKQSAALSSVHESMFRYMSSRELFKRYMELIIQILTKKKSTENDMYKKDKE